MKLRDTNYGKGYEILNKNIKLPNKNIKYWEFVNLYSAANGWNFAFNKQWNEIVYYI